MPNALCVQRETPLRFKQLALAGAMLSACTLTSQNNPAKPVASTAPASFEILVMDTELKPLKQVEVQFWHPLYDSIKRQTDAEGRSELTGLKTSTSYQVKLTGPNLIPQQRSVWLPAGKALRLRFFLEHQHAELKGQILDAQQQPISGAVVQLGNHSAESDASGQISLPLTQTQSQITGIKAFKQGYAPAEFNNGQICHLSPLDQSRRLRFAPETSPLGMSPEAFISATAKLRAASQLESLDWTVDNKLDPNRDTLWLASPTQALSAERQQELESFVTAGGKLIVSGEWAGFGAQNPAAVQALLAGFGLALGGDSLHQNKSLIIRLFPEQHSLVKDVKQLELYQSASVKTLREPAQLLAYSPADGWRIASEGGQGVLASNLVGQGKVLLIGDSSLWLDTDSDGDGISNFEEADNAKLWKNALGW